MSTAKKRAMEAIAALPDDSDPQEVIKSLYRIYRLRSELATLHGAPAEPEPTKLLPGLRIEDGLLVYCGPLGEISDDPVAAAPRSAS